MNNKEKLNLEVVITVKHKDKVLSETTTKIHEDILGYREGPYQLTHTIGQKIAPKVVKEAFDNYKESADEKGSN